MNGERDLYFCRWQRNFGLAPNATTAQHALACGQHRLWQALGCGGSGLRVRSQEVNLSGNMLAGHLPAVLCRLPSLAVLGLGFSFSTKFHQNFAFFTEVQKNYISQFSG